MDEAAHVPVDRVIAKYVSLRQRKEEIERDAKQRANALVQQMDLLEAWLMSHMDNEGVDSMKTTAGTAYKIRTEHASVADWQTLIEYIKANDAYDLLQQRVNKSAVRSRMDIEEGTPPPPGVNWTTKLEIGIRKPSGE